MTASPETSVIIRAFNEERLFPALLAALDGQRYRDFEAVVVDSGSYDRTPHLAREWGARVVAIDSRDFTFGHSLNVGIAAARGRFLAIVSAHAEPVDDAWLGSLIEPLRRPRVAMVYGRQLGGAVSNFGESRDFRRAYGEESYVLTPPNVFANNANSAVRRDLWEQHAFDEALTGLEDVEWAKHWMARDFEIVYEARAAVYHIHEATWPQVRRRYYREAIAARTIGLRRPGDVVSELAREARYLGADLVAAARAGKLRRATREIVLFRAHKSLGTAYGLLERAAAAAPEQRDAMYFDRQAKAVVVRGPHRASLETVRIPEIKPSEILVGVAYEGVCGTDLEILDGTLGYYRSGVAHYPIVPGHEFSGWVARVGANVRGFRPGDAVVVECIQSCGACDRCLAGNGLACGARAELGVIGRNGGYSDYVAAPARFAHLIPAGLDMRKAALCEPTAVVLKGLRRVEWALAVDGKRPRCAVVGAGPIGHLCARILVARGYEVTAFDRDPARLADFAGSPIETARDFADLARFDVVVEATGDPDALHGLLEHSGVGATLLLLGLPYSRREFSFESVVAYEKAIVGSLGSGPAEYEEALRLLPHLPLDAFLQHVVPLDRYAAVWAGFRAHRDLKTMLRVHG